MYHSFFHPWKNNNNNKLHDEARARERGAVHERGEPCTSLGRAQEKQKKEKKSAADVGWGGAGVGGPSPLSSLTHEGPPRTESFTERNETSAKPTCKFVTATSQTAPLNYFFLFFCFLYFSRYFLVGFFVVFLSFFLFLFFPPPLI